MSSPWWPWNWPSGTIGDRPTGGLRASKFAVVFDDFQLGPNVFYTEPVIVSFNVANTLPVLL